MKIDERPTPFHYYTEPSDDDDHYDQTHQKKQDYKKGSKADTQTESKPLLEKDTIPE